jgi:hypothetical protein
MQNIALGVPHCPWDATRVQTLARLERSLGEDPPLLRYRVFGQLGPTPNHVWSEKMWMWGAEQDTTHFLTLQDDALVAPNFWRVLYAMLTALDALPDHVVIGLQAIHHLTPALAQHGCNWYTTSDCLAGVGYVLPHPLLVDFLRWRSRLRRGAIQRINEDTLIGVWCAATDRRIWHPIPTIIDHDSSIPSLYGNAGDSHRNPLVTWRDFVDRDEGLESAEYWIPENPLPRAEGLVPHLGRFYQATPWHVARFVPDFTDDDIERVERDVVSVRQVDKEERHGVTGGNRADAGARD